MFAKLVRMQATLAITLGAVIAVAANAQTPVRTQGAPTTGANVEVRLRDGSVVYGTLERLDADSIVIVAAVGRIALPSHVVDRLSNAGTAHVKADGSTEYWYPNANTTRLFFGPTGRTLDAESGYFANHYVVLGSVSVGITDRVQLGGGTLIIPNSDFWYVLPKVALIRGEKLNVAAGALYGGVRDAQGGIGYFVGTYGSTDNSVTLGVGQGISGQDVIGKPVYMLGAERRVSRRAALVTENYFSGGSRDGLLMYGVRLLGERMTVDLAFINSTGNAVFPGIPYVDFVIKW